MSDDLTLHYLLRRIDSLNRKVQMLVEENERIWEALRDAWPSEKKDK